MREKECVGREGVRRERVSPGIAEKESGNPREVKVFTSVGGGRKGEGRDEGSSQGVEEERLWKKAVYSRGKFGKSIGSDGALRCVEVESKWFVIQSKVVRGRRRDFIEESFKGFSSWVRLGPVGFRVLLEGLEVGCARVSRRTGFWLWGEDGRRYDLELCKKKACFFFRLRVRDVEGKSFWVFIPRGGSKGEGWATVAGTLWSLGVESSLEEENKAMGLE